MYILCINAFHDSKCTSHLVLLDLHINSVPLFQADILKGIRILEDVLNKDTMEVEADEVYHSLALGKFISKY